MAGARGSHVGTEDKPKAKPQTFPCFPLSPSLQLRIFKPRSPTSTTDREFSITRSWQGSQFSATKLSNQAPPVPAPPGSRFQQPGHLLCSCKVLLNLSLTRLSLGSEPITTSRQSQHPSPRRRTKSETRRRRKTHPTPPPPLGKSKPGRPCAKLRAPFISHRALLAHKIHLVPVLVQLLCAGESNRLPRHGSLVAAWILCSSADGEIDAPIRGPGGTRKDCTPQYHGARDPGRVGREAAPSGVGTF